MLEWRIGRGWSEREMETRLDRARGLERNFVEPPESLSLEGGWNHYYSHAVVAHEPPGLPGSAFERGSAAVAGYQFSDPGIVVGHFDPDEPLLGRPMLLELKVLGLHYLCGVVVGAVRSEQTAGSSTFGFRYETLEGHIEAGAEWFLLIKDHETGEIRFRVDAFWRPGQFPNWWSRLGFLWIGPHYQRRWHHRAHARLFDLIRDPAPAYPQKRGRLAHTGPEVTFRSFSGTTPRA